MSSADAQIGAVALVDAEAAGPQSSTAPLRSRRSMSAGVYVDTSVVAKRYLNEARSDDVDAFLVGQPSLVISRLGVVELRCRLARRRRNRDIDARIQARVLAAFDEDLAAGFFAVHPLEDHRAVAAAELLRRLRRHPLRTLDALHLAIVEKLGIRVVATADDKLAAAAASLGARVERFD